MRTLILLLTLTASGLAFAGPPTQFLQGQVQAVRDLLGQKGKLKDAAEIAKVDEALKAIIHPVMEFDRLSEKALRKHWKGLSAQQREQFIQLFKDLVFESYMSEVSSANENYTVAYEGEEAKGRKAAVVTVIAKTKKAEIELVFHLTARSRTLWVAEDVIIDEVSLVENYREQFNKIIAEESFEALLGKMRKRLVKLGAPGYKDAAPAPTKPSAP
ncbi:ABC transporter substrate-binding protein [Myxococcota bacterium]|nr:ABC transporter substrate-binding protein [Myxococcota bacterium]MBU1432478.1 ABC transporter substrate-binding protein [Myxococcota bacterium]MBU1900732.1 ABC transporter substrate-binding protein [Myxococcota bacterium]